MKMTKKQLEDFNRELEREAISSSRMLGYALIGSAITLTTVVWWLS